MKKDLAIVFSILGSLLFTLLFYKENIGLNLLIFELATLSALFAKSPLRLKHKTLLLFLGFTICSAIMVVIHNSVISIIANVFLLICTIGLIALPNVKNSINGLAMGVVKLFQSQRAFFMIFKWPKGKSSKQTKLRKKAHLVLVPTIIVIAFIVIYAIASPFFAKWVALSTNKIVLFFENFMDYISIAMVAVAILGWLISNAIFIPVKAPEIEAIDNTTTFNLTRKRRTDKVYFKWDSLLDEYRIALMLFGSLNVLLLAMNILDIKNVWFGFEWNGQFLKQFVHSGTYMLIFSILLSVWITLHYFRGNLNFLKKNKTLKILAYGWLIQNIILAISVAVRNYWYIQHYALAYKRIAVIFFLILVILGICLVIIKISRLKTTAYLLNSVFKLGCGLLAIMTFFNWDVLISRYNIRHADKSFLHYDFLAKMSAKALPELDLSLEELQEIDSNQLDKPFNRNIHYMESSEFHSIINNRIENFMNQYPSRHWLSWNWADHKAYNLLKKKYPD